MHQQLRVGGIGHEKYAHIGVSAKKGSAEINPVTVWKPCSHQHGIRVVSIHRCEQLRLRWKPGETVWLMGQNRMESQASRQFALGYDDGVRRSA